MRRFTEWLARKWLRKEEAALAQDCQVTFSTPHGRRYLHFMISAIYATIYEGKDAFAAGRHEGRRSVVHEILETIDMVENPDKYRGQPKVQTEEEG